MVKMKLKKLSKTKGIIGIGATLLLLAVVFFFVLFWDKTYPNIYVGNVNATYMDKGELASRLGGNLEGFTKLTLVTYSGEKFDIPTTELALKYDYEKSADQALAIGRSGKATDLIEIVKTIFSEKKLDLVYTIDSQRLESKLAEIADETNEDIVYPQAKLVTGKIVVEKGKSGKEMDGQATTRLVLSHFSKGDLTEIAIPTIVDDPTITKAEADIFEKRAGSFIGKSLTLTFEFDSFTLPDTDILALLDAKGGIRNDLLNTKLDEIAKKIEREPQNPVFNFQDGKVIEFLPAKPGILMDRLKLIQDIEDNLVKLETETAKSASLAISVIQTDPKIQTSQVNSLGIKELIGRGTSKFAHSIPGRVHNLSLAASRLNGTLVPPGTTLSFNEAVGDISQFTGYKQAYIIQGGKTILGDGGGVCQVSTTLFRAAMNAGLPIVERRAHAYRVGYYEQDAGPGYDATVFSPSTDFKIKNDTPAHILIQSKVDAKNYSMVFEIYGTSDGRVAEVGKAIMASQTAPPPDVYQDDPTLPAGVVKQVEYRAWGAKVTFPYKVTRNGETIFEKTFVSNYKPWSAVYLRGISPVQ